MIYTRSAFVYVEPITALNNTISLNEGSGDFSVSISTKGYSLTGLLLAASAALNGGTGAGITYQVSIDRSTRLVTISGDSVFDLNDGALLNLLGFSGDQTGGSSYTGTVAAGTAYYPQFRLQNFVDFTNDQASNDAAVNVSASGITEVVKFGNRQFMRCNIRFATDNPQPLGGEIVNNTNGVSDLRDFMLFAIEKDPLEFVPDVQVNPGIFTECILESTPESSTGTTFRLKEQFGSNLAGFFDTGPLVFRKVVTE